MEDEQHDERTILNLAGLEDVLAGVDNEYVKGRCG